MSWQEPTWAKRAGCWQGLPPPFPHSSLAVEALVTPYKVGVLGLDSVLTACVRCVE